MTSGNFYFIKNEYYDKFGKFGIMENKDIYNSDKHGRPCFYCFEYEEFYWMIPISSKVEKYEQIYAEKVKKYPTYDGIRFGYVNGQKRAFLIQNVFPITANYIDKQYFIENDTVPVTVNKKLKAELNGLVRKVIRFHKKGIKLVLTDLQAIITGLENENTLSAL